LRKIKLVDRRLILGDIKYQQKTEDA